ncbi:MAG: DNA-binding response regulator [Candidatus Makaraimicrobium thalassicum]|nr:MAG: DNA-binding response regulator [Candidatus Omnitrophota bacterium]
MPLTVLIADDHDIIREGIKNILCDQPAYKVVGEAVDGEEVLEKAEKLKPNILLLDISMPKMNGLEAIGQVRRRSPETNILVITVHKANAYIMKAFRAGAKGYLQKENAGEELLPALRKVASGAIYLTSSISSYLVDKALQKSEGKVHKETLLTPREQEISRLVAEGRSAKDIAATLFISRRTVENYKNALFKKLGLHKTSDLIKYAIKHGIVDIDEY